MNDFWITRPVPRQVVVWLVADTDDEVHLLRIIAAEFVAVFSLETLFPKIPRLQHIDCKWMNTGSGTNSSTEGAEVLAAPSFQSGLGNNAPSRVIATNKQDIAAFTAPLLSIHNRPSGLERRRRIHRDIFHSTASRRPSSPFDWLYLLEQGSCRNALARLLLALLPKGPENCLKWRGKRQFMATINVGFSPLMLN